MKKQLPLALSFILLLTVVMSAWAKQMQRPSVGGELSVWPQPETTSIPTVVNDPRPSRSLVLVDFFAGY